MRTITLEEHYASEAFLEGPGRKLKEQAEKADALVRREMGIKFGPSGEVLWFDEPMLVARLLKGEK